MKKRWQIIILLFAAGVINYLHRAALGIAAPLLAAELKLSTAQMGVVFSSFFVGYAFFNFVGGWAADRFGAKRIISTAMAAWSTSCALTALAVGFKSLVLYRVIFGAAEGPFVAVTNKVVNTWFPHREVATAIGVVFCGTPLGGALAGPIVGFIALQWGWRAAFVAAGAMGFVWLVLWMAMARETPREAPGISPAELAEIETNRPPVHEPVKLPLTHYLAQPAVLATAIAYFAYNYILYFFLTWFPSYLVRQQHLSLESTSLASALPWCMGMVGQLLGGTISDAIMRRTGRPLFTRKLVLGICLGVSGLCVGFAGLVATASGAVALMAVAVLFLYLSGTGYWGILQDIIPSRAMGSVGGFVHCIANISGIVGPALTGLLVAATGTFASSFLLGTAVAIAGVLAVLVFVSEKSEQNSYQAG
jgi:sugar phosphate permease